ncbi:MAG: SAM-dependent methyltransferase [Kiritimatiellia bacterium]|jgi:SAM-dependent methyltransferase
MSLGTPAPWDAVAQGYGETTRETLAVFAARALDWADPPSTGALLDVACGPGTLTVLAAERVSRVLALDFSANMVARCRADTSGFEHVEVRRADCQHLQLDEVFDVATSMFGLMFFPDRAAGLASMYRALRPGGVAVVSSWPPFERSSAMKHAMMALSAAFPDAPKGDDEPGPMASANTLSDELSQAGLCDVQVREEVYSFTCSVESFWHGIAVGFAPLALARQTMSSEVWRAAEQRGLAWLRQHHDPHHPLNYVALLGKGVRP